MDDEKRSEKRDPGEHEQNVAIGKGLTDSPELVVEGSSPGKCPTCGRDMVNPG